MHAFDAGALLDLWERSYGLPLPERSLALLAYGYPQHARAELAGVSLGRRDAQLARLRIALFGADMELLATCPHCACVLESQLDAHAFAHDAAPLAQTVQLDGGAVTLRAVTLADLIGLPAQPDAARRALAARCLVADDGVAPDVQALSDTALATIATALEAADPAAATDLVLDCPDCAGRWREGLDIASFLWREIDAWARRTLREVHALARAYAWREADVLALSPTRRRLYLELCGA